MIGYIISGSDFYVMNVQPGYMRKAENIKQGELLSLFWVNEPYDSDPPDSFPMLGCEGTK